MTVLPFRVAGPRCSVPGCGHVESFTTREERDAARTAAWRRNPVCLCHVPDGRVRFRFPCDVAVTEWTAANPGADDA